MDFLALTETQQEKARLIYQHHQAIEQLEQDHQLRAMARELAV